MKLSEIKAELKKMLLQFNMVKTDKGILIYETEELGEGTVVKIENEDGTTEIPTGEYTTEDNKVLVIESGEIKEIREVEVQPVEVVETPEVVEEITEPEVVEETPEEVTDEPVEEVTEPEVVEEVTDEPAEPTEVEVLTEKIAVLETEIAALKAKIEELVSGFEKFSLAKPAVQEFEDVKKIKKTGFDKVDKFLKGINK